MNGKRSLLRTVLGFSTLALATLLFGSLTLLTAWIPPRGRIVTWWTRLWSLCWLTASGVRVELQLPASLDPTACYVYLSNHASWFDIPALLWALPGHVRFAAKRGLFQIPLFGWALSAAGFIPVDRQDRSGAKKVFSAAIERLRAGGSVLFFPEGTRTPDGRLLPFQRGGFLLALKSGLPIVPVGVEGSWQVMARHTWWVSPGTIQVRCGEPLNPADFGLKERRGLMEAVRRQIGDLAGADLAESVAADGMR
jgi:1-acyl-sn-glycerol-3-phosphate acyltransferase